jgi:RNA 3'-terminal phosphate cyclase (ATP)
MSARIEIDGSEGEGGGQILRSSLALSLITGQPFHLYNIRAGRPKPGLAAQHLTCVRAAAAIGSATVRGASLGSLDLTFDPGEVKAGAYRFDVGTAGSVGLVLHTVYLPLALRGQAASEVVVTGGTHVRASPGFPFLDQTWRVHLKRMGLCLRLAMSRPGFYPRGGGEVRATIPSCRLHGVRLTRRGEASRVTGSAVVAGLDPGIARRMARAARRGLEAQGLTAEVAEEVVEGGPGCALSLAAGGYATVVPGERGKPAEKVASEAVADLVAFLASGAAADLHSGDQLLLPLALAEGPSEYTVSEVTRHLRTNAAVIARFVDRAVAVEGEEGKPGAVRVSDGAAV